MGFRIRGFHPLWPLFPEGSPIRRRATSRSRNPGKQASRFGLVRFRSPLLAQSRLMSSPAGTEMFHFPAYGSCGLSLFIRRCRPAKGGGLPHSETSGSKPVDGSPKLVAVFRVLHRLPMPRHPSCARIRLARKSSSLVSYMSCNSLLFPASGCQRSAPAGMADSCVVYQNPRASARGNFKKFFELCIPEVNAGFEREVRPVERADSALRALVARDSRHYPRHAVVQAALRSLITSPGRPLSLRPNLRRCVD